MIALIIVGVLLCCIGPVVACGIGLVATNFGQDLIPEPEGRATITSCEIDNDDDYFPQAEVSYELTNIGDAEGSFSVRVTVYDSDGGKAGYTTDWVWDVPPGSTVSEETTVYLDYAGGSTCTIEVSNSYRW